MKKNNLIWIFVIILIVVLLGAPRLMYGGSGSYMHSGYSMMGKGMMGYGMSGFVLLIPALLMVLIIAAGVWLGNKLSNREHQQEITCSSCSKTVESDWITCPHCSESLK